MGLPRKEVTKTHNYNLGQQSLGQITKEVASQRGEQINIEFYN